jgi:hypothetical protein
MLVARNWILHNKKNFVHDPYVFVGPMPSALPTPS